MRDLLLISILLLSVYTAFGQGGWDIGYVAVDSINNDLIGELVKVDFKHKWRYKKKANSVRDFVTPQDTAFISVEGKQLTVIEYREIYVDEGFFEKQYITVVQKEKDVTKKLNEFKLLEVTNDRLKFEATVITSIKNKPHTETFTFWIEKEKLDGVMIKL